MPKREKPPEKPAAPFHRPFKDLAARFGGEHPPLSDAGSPPEPPAAQISPASKHERPPRPPPARAVVRLERKGRGGKEATVVEKLGLPQDELARWLKELKQSLGCGGALEDGALALQGDLRLRVKAELERRGVRKVTTG